MFIASAYAYALAGYTYIYNIIYIKIYIYKSYLYIIYEPASLDQPGPDAAIHLTVRTPLTL